MTTPKEREEIQRYDPDLKYIGSGGYVAVLAKSEHGDAVTYEDHLRHLKLTQIEVLEEMAKEVCYGCRHEEPVVKIMGSTYHSTGHTAEARESCNSWPITNHIAALKEELAK